MSSNYKKNTLGSAAKTLIMLVLATGSSIAMSYLGVGKESIIMVFLLGVLFSSVLTGSYFWGILNSILSLMAFNFLFTVPIYTFHIYSSNDIILLMFFLITAVVSGTVTSKLQQQIEISLKNENTAKILHQISSGFLPVSGQKSIMHQGISFIKDYTGFDSIIELENKEIYNAYDVLPTGNHLSFEIKSGTVKLGNLLVYNKNQAFDEQIELIIQAVSTQLGIALDRESLYIEREKIRVAMEKEHLRSTLLRSVAHDLRSPLTALSGAANLLADNYETLTFDERKTLVLGMSEEITWLTGLVENILNMTRINDSQLLIHKEFEVIDDVVSEAVSHISRLLNDRNLIVELPKQVIMVPVDGKLIVQVLINLLENAIRHTTSQSKISLEIKEERDFLKIIVADTGEGIAENIKENLFDKFVTLERNVTDGKKGIGLGLAICKAIVEAHGGEIFTESNVPKGSRFIFTLPLEG
ncbi:sensor histidine kinase [Alkalibacter mobilis]|uniref:sensor histidine kinase n=1 Tax=Alkalibacter mobilis TaxID=2787712 RepID=UPI0018A0AF64|nr:ATP-binding protein [Alkalibacter mobilis]MBF7097323.1 DUF4118 domain-containing protein [Alkalibacter mobilis]